MSSPSPTVPPTRRLRTAAARRRKPVKIVRPRTVTTPVPSPTTTPTPTPTPTTTPDPTPVEAGSVIGAADRHLVRRFSAGLTPALAQEVVAAGGGRAWFERQLDAASVPDPEGEEVDTWFDYLARTPGEIFDRAVNGVEPTWWVMAELSRRTVARRLVGSRQVHEVMVDFWSNLLHVPLSSDAACARADYDEVIRTYALDSFEALLQHAIVHPAMGINLNNNTSTKAAPNENLGRELLELHTVGVDAGYTEAEVKDSARILTGYRVDTWTGYKAFYDTSWHATGPVSVLGFTSANGSADGRAVTAAYLSHLARHPATATRIARRLCVRFVRDDPSESIVSAVAAAYTASKTKIVPTLKALVAHPDFAASVGMKLRTPQEDWQAMVRALGMVPGRPTGTGSFARAMYWYYTAQGNAPYEWAAPNGYPDANAAWSSAGRMLKSMSAHRTMTAQWFPTAEMTAPSLATIVPQGLTTPRQMIEAAGVAIAGQKPGEKIAGAIATALGWGLDQELAPWEADGYWTRITIVSSLLDSPLHMYR